MASPFPCFRSDFLNHLCDSLWKRNKSLSQRGSLTHTSDLEDSNEWISIYYRPLVGPYVILQAIENNIIHLFLRSSRRRNRGKILLAMEGLTVVDNATLLVEVFERTLDLIHALDDGSANAEIVELVRREWSKVTIQISDMT